MAPEQNLTEDEQATQQAASGAPGTESGHGEALAEPETPVQPDEMKAWFRANVRWVMAEIDWTRSGRSTQERELLNP